MVWGRLCTGLACCAFGLLFPVSVAAEVGPDPAAADAATDDPQAEIDRLRKMALAELGNVPVSVINPVVEGVSKKEETLADSPGIAQVITAEEIRAFGAKNLYEVLNWATSVYTSGSYLFPDNIVSIRGDRITHDDNHRLVLINGRPFRDVLESGLNSSIYLAFPLDAIHHIEVIRGPGSVLYGTNAYSGVINIVTKKPGDPTGRGKVLAGSFETQKYDLSQSSGSEDSGYLISTTYGRQEGWPFRATGEGPPVQNPAVTSSMQRGYEDLGVFAHAYRGNFTANAFFATTSQTHMGATPTWPTGDGDDLEMDRVFVDFGYRLEPCPDYVTDVHFAFNFLGHQWQLPALLESEAHSYLIEATHHRPLSEDVDLVFGAFTDIHEGGSTTVPDFTEVWYGVYGQLEYRPTDWLKLVGGVQGNMPGEIPAGVSPRASAIVTLTEDWGAKLLYGSAFRSPYALERTVNAPGALLGNPDLIPETVDTYEAQLARPTEDSRIAATYFFSEYHDSIRRVGGAPPTYANTGPMTFHGVELESVWNPNEGWHLLGSVTWQENIDDLDRVDPTLTPNWMGKVGVAYDNQGGLKIGLFDVIFSKPKEDVTVTDPTAAIVNPPVSALNLF